VLQWNSSHYTDVGLVRKVNEDSLLEHGEQQLWAVADGMGGHQAGDYASQHVVNELKNYRQHAKLGTRMRRLQHTMTQCNQHLFNKAASEKSGIIGCTVAALSLHGNQLVCSWSGDSRIYRLRAGELLQLTRDHNFNSLSEDRDRLRFPEQMGGDSELLTAAIGGEEALRLEHSWFALKATDQFLLCTDGLYKEITDTELQSILNTEASPDEKVSNLTALYRERGARDNVGFLYVYSSI